jgi:hypothetical protein
LTDYESGRSGEYILLVGREIGTLSDARAGELVAQIPAGSYALLRSR